MNYILTETELLDLQVKASHAGNYHKLAEILHLLTKSIKNKDNNFNALALLSSELTYAEQAGGVEDILYNWSKELEEE